MNDRTTDSLSARALLSEALTRLRPDLGGDGSVTLSPQDAGTLLRAIAAGLECAASAERLRIAFLVLSESGHGGGMCEVRRWFAAGARGPIPWPGGALFEAWAEQNGIVERDGHMEDARSLTSDRDVAGV